MNRHESYNAEFQTIDGGRVTVHASPDQIEVHRYRSDGSEIDSDVMTFDEARQVLRQEEDARKYIAALRGALGQTDRKEKAKLEREQREHSESLQRDANRLVAFLSGFDQAYSMRTHPFRAEVLDILTKHDRERFVKIENELTWPAARI